MNRNEWVALGAVRGGGDGLKLELLPGLKYWGAGEVALFGKEFNNYTPHVLERVALGGYVG